MTEISIFRTSFIWVQTVPGILAQAAPGAPFSFLGKYGDYAARFDACQRAGDASDLKLPWHTPAGNFYWKYYFEGQQAGTVSGATAWKKLVPFRVELKVATVSADPKVKVGFELFYAPHGLCVVARANYRNKPKTPREIAEIALAVRYDYRFLLDGEAEPAKGFSLSTIADRIMERARSSDLGKMAGFSDSQPLSITTFLNGKDVAPIQQGSDEHFLLETVTSWNRDLETGDLAGLPLKDAQLAIRNADDENMMYARDRGRAIWFPRDFADNTTPLLRCYHQNIVHGSLQTQSIGAFVSWAALQLEKGQKIDNAVLDRAKRAAKLLQIFSAGGTKGVKATYRSASIVEQISKQKLMDAANAVLAT